MQKLISKYGLAAHLAILAVAPLFLSPAAVVWVAVLALIWLVMEPSRVGEERIHDARRRVARAIVSDPVFWVFLLLVVVALVRMFNVGVALEYDAETGVWSIAHAEYPLLPGSVEGSGFPLVGCAVAAGVVAQGCRHCLGRSARGAFALLASALSAAGAFVWVFLNWEGVASARAAAEWSLTNPTFAGGAYGLYLLCAFGSLVSAFESRWLKVMPVALLSVGGNALGLFAFAPPAVVALYAAAAVLFFVYSFVFMRVRMGRTEEFKWSVLVGLGLALAVMSAFGLFPAAFVESRVEPFLTGSFVPQGYEELRAVLSEISLRVWKACPWMGYGHGSFPICLQFNATPADWQVVTPLQKAVPNGYWMLLVERGVVGAFALAVPMALLLMTYVKNLAKGVVVALPHPLSWIGFLSFFAAVLETFIDASFLAPGNAVALVGVLSLSAAAFPKEMRHHG